MRNRLYLISLLLFIGCANPYVKQYLVPDKQNNYQVYFKNGLQITKIINDDSVILLYTNITLSVVNACYYYTYYLNIACQNISNKNFDIIPDDFHLYSFNNKKNDWKEIEYINPSKYIKTQYNNAVFALFLASIGDTFDYNTKNSPYLKRYDQQKRAGDKNNIYQRYEKLNDVLLRRTTLFPNEIKEGIVLFKNKKATSKELNAILPIKLEFILSGKKYSILFKSVNTY